MRMIRLDALAQDARIPHRLRRSGAPAPQPVPRRRERILRSKIQGRLLLTDAERTCLAGIGKRLGRKALEGLSAIVQPDTRRVKKLIRLSGSRS
jgi:hypothetical protein